jgi:ABC-type transporter Mla subunit MlaD
VIVEIVLPSSGKQDDAIDFLSNFQDVVGTGQKNNKVINKVLNQLHSTFDKQNFKNEQEAISGLFSQQNIIGDLVKSLNDGVSSGEVDPESLLKDVQEMLKSLNGGQALDISNMVGTMAGMMGQNNEQGLLDALESNDKSKIEEMMTKMNITDIIPPSEKK